MSAIGMYISHHHHVLYLCHVFMEIKKCLIKMIKTKYSVHFKYQIVLCELNHFVIIDEARDRPIFIYLFGIYCVSILFSCFIFLNILITYIVPT